MITAEPPGFRVVRELLEGLAGCPAIAKRPKISQGEQLMIQIAAKGAHGSILFLFFLICWPCFSYGAGQAVRFPVTIDYTFIKQAFIKQAFNQPGERAVPVNTADGCTRMDLWDPELQPGESALKLISNIKLQTGLPVGKTCLKLGEWQGKIDVLQQLVADPKTMKLGMRPAGYNTYSPGKTTTSLDMVFTNLIQTYLTPYLGKVSLDFSGAVKGVQGFLPGFFEPGARTQVNSWLSTLRIDNIRTGPQGVILDMVMNVDAAPKTPDKGPQSPDAIGRLTKNWEDWDSFLVYQIQALTGQTVPENERSSILENLLDSRYGFVQALEEGTLNQDLIFNQFVTTWQDLGSVFKKQFAGKFTGSPTDYLALIATSDALAALSAVGLSARPEINGGALLQLAKLMSPTGVTPTLAYTPSVNNDLRKFFGFTETIDDSGPSFPVMEIDDPDGRESGRIPSQLMSFVPFVAIPANAAQTTPSVSAVKLWLVSKSNVEPYLERVKKGLDQGADEIFARKVLAERYHNVFRKMVYATAWQESCWRQFVSSKGKVRPLMSYNQSSVGMMQINERVWRGIYKVDSLRWSVSYNIRVGCEILDLYLRRYALKKPEAKTLDDDTLARALYAMYNGGPGQFKKFLARNKSKSFWKIDRLFWEKYSMVKTGEMGKVSVCLIGR